MAIYLIASYDIHDPGRYEEYVAALVPLLEKHGAEILVADSNAKPIEGERRSLYAVLRFDSEEAALGFYDDPAFEAIKKIRFASCRNHNIVLARPAREVTRLKV